jgi:hypothetical protein
MVLNEKQTKEIRGHVLEFFDTKELRDQIEYMAYRWETLKDTCNRLVKDGNFLIYNEDIEKYLNEIEVKVLDGSPYDTYVEALSLVIFEMVEGR